MDEFRAKQRNTTIDYLRLIMALFIVALHANPFAEFNAFVSYFPSQVLSRLGVPFFAAVAGLYFFQNSDEKKYQKTIVKYVEPYLIWTSIYLVYLFAIEIAGVNKISLWYVIRTVFLTGFYHLWYISGGLYRSNSVEFITISRNASVSISGIICVPSYRNSNVWVW